MTPVGIHEGLIPSSLPNSMLMLSQRILPGQNGGTEARLHMESHFQAQTGTVQNSSCTEKQNAGFSLTDAFENANPGFIFEGSWYVCSIYFVFNSTYKASLFKTSATLSDSAVRWDRAAAKQLMDRQ